jgi:hypothetical protein
MPKRNLAVPIAISLSALALCSGLALAETNPIKPVAKPQTSIPASAASGDAFVCGTYKGNEKENLGRYQLHRSTVRKAVQGSSAAPPNSFIYDNVWIVEDDGTLAVSGFNPFDTDNQTIHFVSNSNGSYTASVATFTFDATLGTNLNLLDDATTLQNMLFTFNYFGTAWTNIYINANGIVSFGGVPNPSGFFDSNDFFGPLPKIATYFVDLDPSCPTGDVYWKSEATKATITWSAVREWNATCAGLTNTIQLVLHDDGSFDLTFNGINSTLSANGLPIAVGIHPGDDPTLDIMSFSDELPYAGQVAAGFYERYLDITNPQVNEVGLIQEFYQNFPDVYFQVLFFTNFVQTMSGFANELNIKNDVQGIGIGTFDNSALWGSGGVLESRCNMNRLAAWPTDPTSRVFGGENNFLTIMGQEAGHRWGAFVCFDDPGQVGDDPGCGSNSSLLLGRAYAHWSYYADVDHSSLEGGNWEFVSGNLFTTPTTIDYFGDIDEYIMGVRTAQEVTSTFYVSSPTNDLISNRDNGSPVQGATATGTAVTVTIDDIIAAEGPRVPSEGNKDLRQAFIVLLQNGTSLSPADLDKIANFRRSWEDYFEVSLDGRITCNTRLTEDLPVGVVEGLVRNSGNQPLDSVTVEVLERGFDQFVVSGGRYTFRFMPDSLAAPDTVCATLAFSAPGYQPDTLVCCFPYDTTITKNVTLFGTITGVDDEAPIPVAATTLRPAFPNPFNPRTTLTFVLGNSGPIRLSVYDIKGRLVRTLYDGIETSGEHHLDWNGRNDAGTEVGSGIYFVRLEAESAVRTRKVVFLK